MATSRNKRRSRDYDETPMQDLGQRLEEDEYGYVDTRGRRISHVLISQLPSRQIDLIDASCTRRRSTIDSSLHRRDTHYRTLQLKNATLNSRHLSPDVDKIYEILNADPTVEDDYKIKTLREMHQRLTIKRQVKEKLDADRKKKKAHQMLDAFTRLKLRFLMVFHKLAYELKNLSHSIELWHSSIKAIQGQFGSGVASYFIFLRWLLYINTCNFIVTFCFVVVPQFIYQYENHGNETWSNTSEAFSPYDLLTGSGWMSDSLFYFGHYTHELIHAIPGLHYNMPLAYLLTIGFNSIVNLFAVSYSLTKSYQKNYVDTAGEIKNAFCNKIFCAWDYTIETEEAARLRKIAFCNEIRELLSMRARERKVRTTIEKIIQTTLMIFANIFALTVTVGVGYIIFYLLERKTLQVDIRILGDMTLPLTLTLISCTFYFLLRYTTSLEFYLPKKLKLFLTMIRVVVLRTVMLGVIVYFWMVIYSSSRPIDRCYETELGKEIYRLILVNFFIAVIFFTIVGEYFRRIISVYIFSSVQLSHFDVAYNTLDLIYYQTLSWIGSFCVPMVSLMLIIILILLFYIKINSVALNWRPPRRLWSVNEAQTLFLALTFFMFILSAFSVGYVIFAIDPSRCGPFRNYENTGDLIRNIFFTKGKEYRTSEIVKYLSSPGVMFAFFCALCVIVHYMRAQARAHISVVKKIREQLIMEGKDKVFLLKLFDEALSVHRSSTGSENKDSKNEDPNPSYGGSSRNDNKHEVLINQGYCDYSEQVIEPPIPRNFGPGYLPANVPVNKPSHGDDPRSRNSVTKNVPPNGECNLRSPVGSIGDGDSPHRIRRGAPYPSHQPGFRYLLQGDTPQSPS